MRFPEFDKPWVAKKLVQITSKIGSGKTPKGGEDVYMREGIPFIRSQNVINNSLILDSTHIPQKVHVSMNGSKVLPNDILLNITGGSIGRSCVVPINFIEGNVNQHVSIIRLKDDNPNFLQPILSSSRGQKLVSQAMTGSGREGLNFESIKNFKIYFPPIEEQNKVASFLQGIDKRIQSQSKIIEELKSFKSASSKKIFSQKLRFKDENGIEYPEWKKNMLGEIAYITTGSSNREDSNLDGEFTFFDRSQDIRSSNRYLFDAEAIIVPGEGQEFIPKYHIGKFDLHQRTYAIMNFNGQNGKFLYYSISFNSRHLDSHAVGSTVKSLRLPMFEKMPINLPSFPEQTKIADFLSAIDDKIESEKKILAQYKKQKAYLLQNMFI